MGASVGKPLDHLWNNEEERVLAQVVEIAADLAREKPQYDEAITELVARINAEFPLEDHDKSPAVTGVDRVIRTEPGWSLFTTYTVALLDVPTHRHGKSGKSFVSYKDAAETLFACIKAMEK